MTEIKLTTSEFNARLLERAAAIVAKTRDRFILDAALLAAHETIVDRTEILVDAQTFEAILDWMDSPPSEAEIRGFEKLARTEVRWSKK